MGELPEMQHEIEHSRMTADGKRTDDGAKCTLLVVHEVGGSWVMYPHGWGSSGCGYRRVKRSGWPGRSWMVPREHVRADQRCGRAGHLGW